MTIGEGEPGLADGSFSGARFRSPQGLCWSGCSGFLYVADTENHVIRKARMLQNMGCLTDHSCLCFLGQRAFDNMQNVIFIA